MIIFARSENGFIYNLSGCAAFPVRLRMLACFRRLVLWQPAANDP